MICRGGFFAGKVTSLSDCIEGRFDPNSGDMGVLYRARYLNDGYFEALRLLKEVAVTIYPVQSINACSILKLHTGQTFSSTY
jgi:hypothetical protein